MTTVMFKDRAALTNPIHIGVCGDNLSETVSFVLDGTPQGLVFLKLDYDGVADKLLLTTQDNTAIWLVEGDTLQRAGKLFAQLQIENAEGVVWQSETFVLNCAPAIDADKQIEKRYPSILTAHELRISQLEESGGGAGGQGAKGDTGEQGPQGEKGDKGDTGEQGPQGEKGDKGDTGERGPQGEQGPMGPPGTSGGGDGSAGPQGEKGDKGEVGDQGPQGEKGDKGDDGAQGPQGEKGDKGEVGDQGPQGEKGDKGEVGDQGPQGEKGDKGDIGDQGPQGEKGDKGEVGDLGPQGEKGDKGDDGLTTSVNGVGQINGNVSLSAEDIPYTSPQGAMSTGAALDKLDITLGGAPMVHVGNPVSFLAGENRIESIYLRGNSIQLGSGDVSPENYRPIVGMRPAITVNGVEYSLSDAGEIHGYNGVYDELDSSGLEIRRNKLYVFDGTEVWNQTTSVMSGKVRPYFRDSALHRSVTNTTLSPGLCSHFAPSTSTGTYEGEVGFASSATTNVVLYFFYPERCNSLEDFQAWLGEQYAAGTPVQLLMPCAEAAITQTERSPLLLPNAQGFVTVSADGEVEVRLGTLALKSDIKNITVSSDEPSGGKNGDIYFRNMGDSIRTYVKIENIWVG